MALENRPSRFIYKAIATITLIWLLGMSAIWAQYRETSKLSSDIVELGNSIMSFHNSLHFRAPYRVTHANDMSLNIQLIYSLRVQLEADYQKSWLQPDVTHLLYVVDKFIEKSQLFLTKELGVLNMVEELKKQRAHYESDPRLKQYYVELGAYLFEALFTEDEQGPEIYRALERLMRESQSLSDDKDRQALQLTLAKVSKLLSGYAEGNNLVSQLLQHEIYRELFTIEQQYYQIFGRINVLLFALSIVLITALTSAITIQRKVTKKIVKLAPLDTELNKGEGKMEPISVHNGNMEIVELPIESKIDIQLMLSSLNGDVEAVKMLLNVFIEDHQHDGETLKQRVETDLTSASRMVHSLKGVAGTVGASELRAMAIEVEAKLKQGEKPLSSDLDRLASYLEGAVNGAKYWIEQKTF